jgi:hypothetical protein
MSRGERRVAKVECLSLSLNPDVFGLYIGSADNVAQRIKAHQAKRHHKRFKNSNHHKFWNVAGRKDFWILVAGMRNMFVGDRQSLALAMNIAETYGCLLARTLRQSSLRAFLPKGASLGPYKGMTGLNNFLPLQQWRQVLGEASLTPHGRRIKGESKFWSRIQPRSRLIRDVDPKQGDQTSVLIGCSKCPVETRIVYEDRNPRYEISTGKYVLSYRQCQLCGRALFTTINTELLSVRVQYVLRNAREIDAANRDLVAQELQY